MRGTTRRLPKPSATRTPKCPEPQILLKFAYLRNFFFASPFLLDKLQCQVAGSWVGLRKTLRVSSFLRLCLTSPASVGAFNLFRFGPERTALGSTLIKAGP